MIPWSLAVAMNLVVAEGVHRSLPLLNGAARGRHLLQCKSSLYLPSRRLGTRELEPQLPSQNRSNDTKATMIILG